MYQMSPSYYICRPLLRLNAEAEKGPTILLAYECRVELLRHCILDAGFFRYAMAGRSLESHVHTRTLT